MVYKKDGFLWDLLRFLFRNVHAVCGFLKDFLLGRKSILLDPAVMHNPPYQMHHKIIIFHFEFKTIKLSTTGFNRAFSWKWLSKKTQSTYFTLDPRRIIRKVFILLQEVGLSKGIIDEKPVYVPPQPNKILLDAYVFLWLPQRHQT